MTSIETLQNLKKSGQTISFVSGNFNIIHPGHLRFLLFAAEQADILVVGLYDYQWSISAYFSNDERCAALAALSCVDHVITINNDLKEVLRAMQPEVVVKGKEFEDLSNEETEVLEEVGGKLLFSSGEKQFSSRELLSRQHREDSSIHLAIQKYHQRYNLDKHQLFSALDKISCRKVAVIGDLIVDEYQECLAIGMSQEDPTIAVSPLESFKFIGGAGIVAAHAAELGAEVDFYSVSGTDSLADFARKKLDEYNVTCVMPNDHTRPTTHKLRYRAKDKTLLRVNNFRRHEINRDLISSLLQIFKARVMDYDLVIFADFSFGVACPNLIDEVSAVCKKNQVEMVADSQTSSQVGDLTKFKHLLLTTPTELEARQAAQDDINGLIQVSDNLTAKLSAQNLIVTLGAEGILIRHQEEFLQTDNLPAFSETALDTAGAGDAFMVTTSLLLKCGLTIWQAAFMGSVASAIQVNIKGNTPLSKAALIEKMDAFL